MRRLLHILLLSLVALAPLPLGSNREWSWTLCALLTAILAIAWSLDALVRGNRDPARLPAVPALLFLAACAWVVVQVSPWAPAGWRHPLWDMTARAVGHGLPGYVSLSRDDSLTALMRLLAYGLVFFLSFQFALGRDRAQAAFRWLAGAGFAYSVFGLIAYWGGLEMHLWFGADGANQAVRGPFANRNSFATWLGLCILCALAVLYQRLALRRNPFYRLPGSRPDRIERFILRAWKPLAVLLVMLSALILTSSRAGFGSFVVGALVLAMAVQLRHRVHGGRPLAALGAAFAVTILAFALTSRVLLERMDRIQLDAPGRLHVYALAGAASEDNPWLGFGYGTFADSFRLYRDDSLEAHFDMAHNTWLENAFELGWPAALALYLAIGWVAWRCLHGVRKRSRDWIYPATGLAATALVAVHSAFDFSLQMPAVALAYACLLGTACAQALPSAGQADGP